MNDLVIDTILSHKIYVLSKVRDIKSRKLLSEELTNLTHKLSKIHGNFLPEARHVLKEYNKQIKPKSFLSKILFIEDRKRDMSLLALSVVSDIVDSIELRFVTGGDKVFSDLLTDKVLFTLGGNVENK